MKTLFRLKPAKKLKTDFYVFDTETVKRKGKKLKYDLRAKSDAFYFGVVYGHNFTKVIYSVEDFIKEFQLPRYKNCKVFAHNAEYDLNVLFDNIYEFDNGAIFNGKFISASNGNCIFADSMNIYPTSVKKLGAMMNLNKGSLNQGNINKWFDGSKGIPIHDINYCIRDCEIVFEALFQAFEFSGQIAITQASLSLAYFRRYHLPYNITHDINKTKYFYHSYFGGRTECFKMGKTFARGYDVNSMYPDRMKNIQFPNPLRMKIIEGLNGRNLNLKQFNTILKKFEGVAHVKINHFDSWIGYLPYKQENGKLIFPIGNFSGWYNFNELRFALKHKAIKIIEVYKYVYSEPMTGIFDSFVNHLYSQRYKSSNDFEVYRIKIFMNSLYGKLAQRINQEQIYINDISSHENQDLIQEHKRNKTFIKLQMFSFERNDAFLIVRKKFEMLSYSIPSFASYITSAARIKLLEKLLDCKDNIPVYCDTDSIYVENEIEQPLKIRISNTPILGDWEIENKHIINVRGLKNYEYMINGEVFRALKGVPKNAKKIGDNKWEYMNLTKTKEALRRNIEAGIQIKRTKEISEIYDKRIVLKDGQTKPIKL